jgi:hypothetical protein
MRHAFLRFVRADGRRVRRHERSAPGVDLEIVEQMNEVVP